MPPSRPLNPTVLFLLVGVTWVVIEVAVGVHWIVTILIAAAVVNAVLWFHTRWGRRRSARGLDHSRPYSREQESSD